VAGRIGTDEPHPAAADRPAGEPLADLGVAQLPILIVDDRDENLRTLEAVLAPLGLPLHTASSGGEALRILLERDFALILLDVRMPGLDGIETARLIKARPRTRDVPIVFLTAARDEVSDIMLGYGVGAVDYVLKPFDPDLLRSKVAVFAELEASRRALKRSEAFLRGAFEAAPIGKTVLDSGHRIIRSNPAFARMLGRSADELQGIRVEELCHPEDREGLSAALERVSAGNSDPASPDHEVDLRLQPLVGAEVWVAAVCSSIEQDEFAQLMLLIQWVDLSARRRAAEARAELLVEQSARSQAEDVAARLGKLHSLTAPLEKLSLEELLRALTLRLEDLFEAEAAEVRLDDGQQTAIARAAGGQLVDDDRELELAPNAWIEAPIQIDENEAGRLRVARSRSGFTGGERSLLYEAAERAALSIRRAQLHEEEHRIAVELQRGLLPQQLPDLPGVRVAVHYEAAGVGAQVGGDWYDAFPLGETRIGVVVGDVAGRGIPAASMMGQLRTLTRGFALADEQTRLPGDVLTRVNEYQLALSADELFTVLYAVLDPVAGTVWWANAGHPLPLLRRRSGTTTYLKGGEGLIGIEQVTYRELTSPIAHGETLILYTDGLIERRGESLDVGMRRLTNAAEAGPREPDALCEHILNEVLPPERRLDDDVTVVVIQLV